MHDAELVPQSDGACAPCQGEQEMRNGTVEQVTIAAKRVLPISHSNLVIPIPSTVNSQHEKLNRTPSTLNPKHEKLYLKPSTLNPKP